MKRIASILFVFCLIVSSCRDNSSFENSNDTLFINNDNIIIDSTTHLTLPLKNGERYFDKIVDSVWYVPLSTESDSSLIHRVNDIKFYDENIYVADYKQNCLFKFSKDGKFLKRLKQRGDGPTNYKRLSSFEIDTVNNEICLLDGDLGKILLYNLSFEYDSVYSLPIKNVDHISLFGDNQMFLELGFRYFDKSGISSNLVLYDIEKKEIVNSFFQFKNQDIKYHTRNDFAFSRFQNKLFYWCALGNSIYECNDSTLRNVLTIDLGKYQVPLLSTFRKSPKNALNYLIENKFAYVDAFFEMQNWIYARVSRKRNAVHYFYNKQSKDIYVDLSMKSTQMEKMILPQLFKVSDTVLCGNLSAKAYSYIDPSYDPENNPVLVFYLLK